MKNRVLHVFFILVFLTSCKEDEDRVISTDLPTEASQLFIVSNAWSEALFFTQLSFDQYSNAESLDLPGCPEILLDKTAKRVTLTFDPAKTCEQTGKSKRSGKLILNLSQSDAETPIWFLEYENYTFEDASINGIRTFTKNSLGVVNETFETLTHKTKNLLTHQFAGNLTHTLSLVNGIVIGVNSKGMINGRNPAGRNFVFDFNDKRELLFSCFQDNQLLPVAGKETWQVSRSETSQLTHSLMYEWKEKCKVEAYVVLSDGRRLLLNP
ncbi:MAG: hypothetical protein PSV36_05210 [Algoriphagus sp.]|nr:hypothetical protein [Algoriphagus sp.]